MSEDTILSGTPEGGAAPAVIDAADESAAASEPVTPTADPALPVSPPVSMFRPTMHDGSSASETAGRTVPDRPLETLPDGPTAGEIAGEIAPSDGTADQDLILGAPEGDEVGDGGDPIAEASEGATAPALAADLIDGTNLFGDRAAMWSGNPSEVGAGDGGDPSHAEICLCDQASLAPDPEVPDLAS